MDAMESHAPSVAKRFSGFATQITRPTTVLDVRRVGKFSPIGVCRGYCDRTGHVRSRRLSLSSVARNYEAAAVLFKVWGGHSCPPLLIWISTRMARCNQKS